MVLRLDLGAQPIEKDPHGPGFRAALTDGVIAAGHGIGAVAYQRQSALRERRANQAMPAQQDAVARDGGLDSEAGLIEAQARAHVPDRHMGRLEIAAPGGKLVAGLVVVDQRQGGERRVSAQARLGEQLGRRDRKDLLVHQEFDLATRLIVGIADGDVERPVVEIGQGDDRGNADVDLGRGRAKALQFGHQPKRGDGRRGGDRDLLPSAAAIEGEEGGFELVEPFRQFLQRVGGGRRENQLAIAPLEQRRLQKFLERAYLMADRRGRDAKLGRRLREAQMTSRGLESPQRIQGDVGPHALDSVDDRPAKPPAFPPGRKDGTEPGGQRD